MQFKLWLENDLKVGQIIDIPADKTRMAFKVKIAKIQGDTVWLTQSLDKDDLIGAFKMPKASVQHFINDLSQKVQVKGKSDDYYVQAVIDGKGEYLGKGDDGVVYAIEDKAIKVSTTVPYVPTNPFHKSPAQSARRMYDVQRIQQQLKDAGVPCILPSYIKFVGDKAFMVQPRIQLVPLSFDQLQRIRKSVEEINKRGYAIRDEIQAGVLDGKAYHYDLSKIMKGDKHDFKNDMSNLKMLYNKYGFTLVDWQHWEEELAYAYFVKGKPEDRIRRYTKKLLQLKQDVLLNYPERKDQIEKEFQAAVDSL